MEAESTTDQLLGLSFPIGENAWEISVLDSKTLTPVYKDLRQQILEARHTVCDTTWGSDIPSYLDEEEEAYQTYVETVPEVCKKGVIYREIMTFNDAPEEFIERAEFMLAQNLITYNLRYYDVTLRNIPPLMPITITDSQKVSFAFYRWPHLPIEGEFRLSIQQPQIGGLFQDYFDTLWKGARLIKEGDRIYMEEFMNIKQRLLNK